MNLLSAIGNGIKAGFQNHGDKIFLAINLIATGVMAYEIWTRKDSIQEKLEEKKDAPFMEKAKAVAPDVARIAIPMAIASGSAVGGYVFAAKKIKDSSEKLIETMNLANASAMASDAYEKATKEIVGEEKEKEIREKVATEEEQNRKIINEIQNPSSGYDVYYDETNPGFDLEFNVDRLKTLEEMINHALNIEQLTMSEVYEFEENITSYRTSIDAPSTSIDIGWPSGTKVQVKSTYAGTRNGRAIFQINYSPAPVFLYKKC